MPTITAYQCQDCLRIESETDERRTADPCEFWGERVLNVTVELLCMHCGGDDVREVEMCEECELDVAMSGRDRCFACESKAEDRARLASTLVDIGRATAGRYEPSAAHG